MKLELSDNTGGNNSTVVELINEFFPYSQKRLGFDKPVSAELTSDPNNAKNPLGKTAYYDPNKMHIVLFTDDRHPKDILRSFSHELVHHSQNCRGEFDDNMVTEEGYAQNDEHLREMEKEAYLEGQLILRDWTDTKKENNLKMNVNEEIIRNIARRVLESITKEEKKPDADGDGVPPWADKDDEDKEVQEEQIEEGGRHDPDSGYDELRQDRDDAELDRQKQSDDESETVDESHCGKRDDDETLEEEESLEEGGAAARTGNEDKDNGRDRMHADRVHEGNEGHDCDSEHPGKEHDEWEQSQRVGPIAHTKNSLSENKKPASNYDLYLKEKDGMLFEKLMKKWCK